MLLFCCWLDRDSTSASCASPWLIHMRTFHNWALHLTVLLHLFYHSPRSTLWRVQALFGLLLMIILTPSPQETPHRLIHLVTRISFCIESEFHLGFLGLPKFLFIILWKPLTKKLFIGNVIVLKSPWKVTKKLVLELARLVSCCR